jgi:hypothetical protein
VTPFAQLLSDTANDSRPLSGILLRTRLIARQLKSPDFNRWVKLELNGYPRDEVLPDYRIVYPMFFGHFHGAFGSSTKNVPLSTTYFPNEIRSLVSQHPMPNDIASLEQLLASNTETYHNPQPGHVVEAFRRYGEQISGQTLNHVEGIFTKPTVAGILHQIRTRLLDFFIELSDEYPGLESDSSAITNIPVEVVSCAAQQFILHDCKFFNGASRMGDSYNAQQVGAMGPNASAQNMTFQQIWNNASGDIKLGILATELRTLMPQLSELASQPEHKVAIGNVDAAADAAAAGDGPKALRYLVAAGKWFFDAATKLGIGVAVAAAKSHLGY